MAGGEKTRSRRIHHRIRTGDLILIVVFALLALLFFRFSFDEIVGYLFEPVVGLILLIMIVEFLWIKSSDRTRIYRLQCDRLREQRRRDESLLRRARESLNGALESPGAEEDGRPGDWRQKAIDLRRDIDERL